jgi:hypothetical protein
VPECSGSVGDYTNLCDKHTVPGAIIAVGRSTMVVTVWVAEHDDVGFIFLNDYALGDSFGGRVGFEAKLAQQGFTRVRNVESPLQFDSEQARIGRPASWSGPWLEDYPWEWQ